MSVKPCFPITKARNLQFKSRFEAKARILGNSCRASSCSGEEVRIQIIITSACTPFTEANIIAVNEERRIPIHRFQTMLAGVGANIRVTPKK